MDWVPRAVMMQVAAAFFATEDANDAQFCRRKLGRELAGGDPERSNVLALAVESRGGRLSPKRSIEERLACAFEEARGD
jgi:hypothetical protein